MKRLGAILLLLAGCGRGPDEHICNTPAERPAVGDWEGCVHRWAYRLASVEGAVPVIAKAVVAGCADAVEAAELAPVDRDGMPIGKPSPPLSEKALGMGMFYVAQARAGRCAIP